ncbi:hypothetical protein PtrEW13061_011911 [Pyrenophora tritici-repentis]|nr:hypothetical protein PtrEW13061_011911 [Pyrenophora tritici-repentis]
MFPQLETFKNKLNHLRLSTAKIANILHSSALEEVEQEREVEFQVEEVLNTIKPNQAQTAQKYKQIKPIKQA